MIKKNKTRFITIFIIPAILSMALISCGVKPKNIDRPDGATPSDFPRTYPDVMTSPIPMSPPLP